MTEKTRIGLQKGLFVTLTDSEHILRIFSLFQDEWTKFRSSVSWTNWAKYTHGATLPPRLLIGVINAMRLQHYEQLNWNALFQIGYKILRKYHAITKSVDHKKGMSSNKTKLNKLFRSNYRFKFGVIKLMDGCVTTRTHLDFRAKFVPDTGENSARPCACLMSKRPRRLCEVGWVSPNHS